MYRTFNCGIGLVLCIPASQSKEALNLLKEMDVDATRLGSIAAKADSEKAIILK
jgi:phosphoribosylformylglycinamidine cyclo-ligase